jgi:hypothetical protein
MMFEKRMHLKGGLISEVILTFGHIAKKKVANIALSRKFEFPALYSKQLIQTLYSGARFGTFWPKYLLRLSLVISKLFLVTKTTLKTKYIFLFE